MSKFECSKRSRRAAFVIGSFGHLNLNRHSSFEFRRCGTRFEMMPQVTSTAADEMKTRKVELVLQQLDSLPTLPVVALRLMALTGSPDAKMAEVVALLSADQSLTTKLLSLANSAMVGLKSPITSVQHAVVMLGFETVRNLVLSVKVFEIFQQRGTEEEETDAPTPFERTEFWKHSLAVATASEMLASRSEEHTSELQSRQYL